MSKVLSTLGVDKIQGTIYLEAKLFSRTMKPDRLRASKTEWCEKCRIDIPIQKRGIERKKVQNLSRQIPLDLKH